MFTVVRGKILGSFLYIAFAPNLALMMAANTTANGPMDDGARKAAHDVLGVQIYPGTEIMADVANVHLKHTGQHALVPQPSDDPNDPLNWSRTWKWLTMSSMALSTFNYAFSPLSLSPQVPYYMESFDSTLPEVINFIGVSVLVLGFTNFIWIPLSRGFGRRPVAIVTTLITTASCIWRARATTYNSFLGSAILCGIGSSPGETLGPVIIADIAFLHERGLWMGVYQWAFWSGLMVGPIVAGVMAQEYGWRSYWWLSTAISAFANLWVLFFQPETKWDRRAVGEVAPVGELPNGIDGPHLKNDFGTSSIDGRNPSTTESKENGQTRNRPLGKPNKAQLLPLTKWNPHESILAAVWLPIKMLKLPIVIWGALQFNFSANIYLMINITQSQALGAPPFNLSPAAVGYTNLALFVGVSFSLVTAGPLSDWISNRATLRNRGIREPEMRLPALVPFVLCGIVGCVVTAVGFQHGWSWESVVIVGFGFIGVHTAGLSGIAINYVIDCYKPSAGEFLVCATVFKNVFGYGMSRYFNDWVMRDGYIGPFMTILALNLGCLLFGAVPLYFYGKKVRGWSANSSIHRVS